MTAPNVTIYTTETCSYCQAEKAFLRQHQLPYTEVQVDVDEAAAEAMIEFSGQMSVPVTVIRRGAAEEQIVGFDQPRIAAALGV